LWKSLDGVSVIHLLPSKGAANKDRDKLQEDMSIPRRGAMLVVHVFIQVNPGDIDAFMAATLENARNSVQEPGIARFDVLQQADDPTRFVLSEAYRTPEATVAHKETAHYATWRDTVAPMMAAPRTSVKYSNAFPEDAGF
jgi:quinol monooxygenase YgiN